MHRSFNLGPRRLVFVLARTLLLATALGACGLGSSRPGRELTPSHGPVGHGEPPIIKGDDTPIDPGTVTLHRLNRVEYNNTVHDLLGTQQTPGDALTQDAQSNGFDNNADALTLSSADVTLYQAAAEALAGEAAANGPWLAANAPCPGGSVATCLTDFVRSFGRHAWRRPLTTDEQQAIIAIASNPGAGTALVGQVEVAINALLLSPNFLFRVEVDPPDAAHGAHPLNDYELATRLSYFLWSSTPDKALLDAAAAGTLRTDAGLLAETQRLLADPRSDAALSLNFAGQWLGLRNTRTYAPDPNVFPDFDASLRDAMLGETSRFFADFLHGQAPVNDLFTARYTYVNSRLARFYGLPAPASQDFVRVTLPTGGRYGLLGQAAVLAATSAPARTSPVRRGAFVRSQLLCRPIPPPPPNVPSLPGATPNSGTQRQRLAAHAGQGVCKGCHMYMDPYGFALESFDAVGQVRRLDNGLPVDTAVVLPDGLAVDGPAALQQALADDPRFGACVLEKLFGYALGRTVASYDAPVLAALSADFAGHGLRLDRLLTQLVLSPSFRMRRPHTETTQKSWRGQLSPAENP